MPIRMVDDRTQSVHCRWDAPGVTSLQSKTPEPLLEVAVYYKRPIANYVRRRLAGGRTLEATAARTEIVQPVESEWSACPAVYLPGQLERAAAGVEGHGSLAGELAACLPGLVTHAAIVRYTLRDAIVHADGYDVPGHAFRATSGKLPLIRTKGAAHYDRVLYCMSAVSRRYFGHWLQDACATALLSRGEDALALDERPDWPHAGEYLAAFGLQPAGAPSLRVGELTVYQDHGQGSSKRERYRRMRTMLRDALPASGPGPSAVYLRRGATGTARVIENDQAISEALARRGFEVVDLDGTSAASLHGRLRDAAIVVSMDGSHLNHIYTASNPDTAILSFIPADRFTATNVGYARAAGMRFGLLVAPRVSGGYRIDETDLLKTLDILVAAAPPSLSEPEPVSRAALTG